MNKITDIPSSALCCPKCKYDLRGTLSAPIKQCPECGLRFSKRDLIVLNSRLDPNGEPASFSPHEFRINGRWLIWPVIILAVGLVGFILWTIFFGQPIGSAAY